MANIGLDNYAPLGAGNPRRRVAQKLMEIVSIGDYGKVGLSAASDAALFDQAKNAIGSVGCVINPKDSLLDFSDVTVPNGVMVLDMQGQRIVASNVGIGKSVQASGGHALIRDIRDDTATRVHIEPNGHPSGTASKLDWMFDPYEDDGSNYRIANLYTKRYDASDTSTTQGDNGVVVLGVKGVGHHWGVWPTLHVGFSDDGADGSVPMKFHYFDTSDTTWRTPMKGAWRSGISVTAGDYILANNKLYQADGSGTTGGTAPGHTSGSASDGAVSWTFVRAPNGNNVKGLVLFGDRDSMPKFGFPEARAQYAKDAIYWNGVKHRFLKNDATEVWNVGVDSNTDDLYIKNAAGTKFLRFGPTFMQPAGLSELLSTKTVTDNSATPDVTGTQLVIFTNGSATNITSMNGTARQRLIVQAGNGNTTLVNSASIRLNTGANKTLTANSCLEFVANGAGTAWVEVGTL